MGTSRLGPGTTANIDKSPERLWDVNYLSSVTARPRTERRRSAAAESSLQDTRGPAAALMARHLSRSTGRSPPGGKQQGTGPVSLEVRVRQPNRPSHRRRATVHRDADTHKRSPSHRHKVTKTPTQSPTPGHGTAESLTPGQPSRRHSQLSRRYCHRVTGTVN